MIPTHTFKVSSLPQMPVQAVRYTTVKLLPVQNDTQILALTQRNLFISNLAEL